MSWPRRKTKAFVPATDALAPKQAPLSEEENTRRLQLDGEINAAIDAESSMDALNTLEFLEKQLPTIVGDLWIRDRRNRLKRRIGEVRAVLDAQQQLSDLHELLDDFRENGDAGALLTLAKYKASSGLPDQFELPPEWNTWIAQLIERPKPAYFNGLDIAKLIDGNGAAWEMHAIIRQKRLVDAAYVLAYYDSQDSEDRAYRFDEFIGAETGLLLFSFREIILNHRAKLKQVKTDTQPIGIIGTTAP